MAYEIVSREIDIDRFWTTLTDGSGVEFIYEDLEEALDHAEALRVETEGWEYQVHQTNKPATNAGS